MLIPLAGASIQSKDLHQVKPDFIFRLRDGGTSFYDNQVRILHASVFFIT